MPIDPDYHHRPTHPPVAGEAAYQRVIAETAPTDAGPEPPRRIGTGLRVALAVGALVAGASGAHATGLVDVPGLPDPDDTVEVLVDEPTDGPVGAEVAPDPTPTPTEPPTPLDRLPPLADLDDLPIPPELRDLFDQLGGGQFDPGDFDRFLEENFDPERLEELFGDPEALQAEIDGLLEQLGVDPTLLEDLFSQFSDLAPPGD